MAKFFYNRGEFHHLPTVAVLKIITPETNVMVCDVAFDFAFQSHAVGITIIAHKGTSRDQNKILTQDRRNVPRNRIDH